VVDDASQNNAIIIRQAATADIAELVRLRRVMCEAMGFDGPDLDAAEAVWTAYFGETIPAGEFHGWLAITPEGKAVSACGVVIDQHPPTPGNLSGRIGYLMNVVTMPKYRGQGLARRVIQTALQWLDEQDIRRVTLHATDMGQSLYTSLGFEPVTNEMRLTN
jgi:ribosomal protein S18 acetylase RimI-like enzyme